MPCLLSCLDPVMPAHDQVSTLAFACAARAELHVVTRQAACPPPHCLSGGLGPLAGVGAGGGSSRSWRGFKSLLDVSRRLDHVYLDHVVSSRVHASRPVLPPARVLCRLDHVSRHLCRRDDVSSGGTCRTSRRLKRPSTSHQSAGPLTR